jgi:hypothetical protein
MKGKKLIVWAVALAVVLAVVFTAGKLRSMRPSEKSLLFFPGLSQSTCSRIVIASAGDTAVVKRTGDVWVVAGSEQPRPATGLGALTDTAAKDTAQRAGVAADQDYAVDSATFASVFEKLTSMKRDELISQNPEKQAMFEVDSAKATWVQVWDDKGKVVSAFRVGKNGPDWSMHFVRVDGSNDVYLVRGSIKYAFASDKKRWRDRCIVRFTKSAARKVTIQKQATTLVLEQGSDSAAQWQLTAPKQSPVLADKLEDLLGALSFLTCSDWETRKNLSDKDMGFDAPELVATVTLVGGAEERVVVGRKAEGQDNFWVRTPGKPGVTFLVGSYNISRLDKKLEDLLPRDSTAAAAAPAAKTTAATHAKPAAAKPTAVKPVAAKAPAAAKAAPKPAAKK